MLSFIILYFQKLFLRIIFEKAENETKCNNPANLNQLVRSPEIPANVTQLLVFFVLGLLL